MQFFFQCTFFVYLLSGLDINMKRKKRKCVDTLLSQLRDTLGLGVSRGYNEI